VICGVRKNKKNSFDNVRTVLLYCLLIYLCTSCSKGGGGSENNDPTHAFDPNDYSYPSVEVTTPTDSQEFTSGSVINVTGKVSDNSIFQGSITITNDATGAVVKIQYYEIHYIPVYNFSLSCTISVTATTDYTATVRFEDHGHNETVKTVKIKVNP